MKKKHLALLIILLILALLIAGAAYYYIRESKKYEDRFFHGTVINGLDAEGMTVEEVEAWIEAGADKDYTLQISFPDGALETITADDIAYAYESDGSVQMIKNAQHPLEWIRGYMYDGSMTVPVNMTYNTDLLDQKIASLPELTTIEIQEPADAYMEFQDSSFVIVPDIVGIKLNRDNIVQKIKDAVSEHNTELQLTESDTYIITSAAVKAEDPKLNEQVNTLNSFVGASITYDLPGSETQVLDGSVLIDWLTKDADGSYTKDPAVWDEKIRAYVADLAGRIDTIGTVKNFPATGIGDVQVTCMTYGYEVDQESEIAWLTEALQENAVTERTPAYFSWETSDPDVNNGFGNTYIEIDCSRQHLWAYENGVVAFETDIISGAMDADRATPSGAFMFVTKESPSVLVGKDDNGKVIYRTQVSYFMPFNSMAIGIHDATWQPAFGGSMYLQGYGSHGCINVSYSAAETLYNMITFDEPVVVYY
ncbi:MAG: L,D-transpeptidase/peptidoglycan binding protein [Eubacterium sp.]|nr:L,D-transpeptidase/peptidoglycan binding protein [Eubacterium sp.]